MKRGFLAYAFAIVLIGLLAILFVSFVPSLVVQQITNKDNYPSAFLGGSVKEYITKASFRVETACNDAVREVWSVEFLQEGVYFGYPEDGEPSSTRRGALAVGHCRRIMYEFLLGGEGWPGPERASTEGSVWQSRGDLAAQEIVRAWEKDLSLGVSEPMVAKDLLKKHMKAQRKKLVGDLLSSSVLSEKN